MDENKIEGVNEAMKGGFLKAVLDRPWEDITEDKNGGILKKIIKEGYGAKNPENKSEVEVHYEGTLETGEKFDSSRDRNQKFKFKLGAGQVIKGWDLGVKTMKKGELSKFKIRADYAYGENGAPPKIPPNATLLFDIELYDSRISTDVSDKKDGGVLKRTIKEGNGWEQPNDGTKVTLKYSILLDDEDLGIDDDKEFSFVIGDELTFSGFDIAAKKLKKNEIAIFTIRSDYIFNSAGNSDLNLGPIVPPNSDVILKLEMLDFIREKEPYQLKSPAEKFSIAIAKKEEGNVFFKEGRYQLALKRYKKALSFIQYGDWKDMKCEVDQLLVSCHSNMAIILLKNSAFDEVLVETKRVLDIDPNNIKALFRRGAAFMGIREYEPAVDVLSKAAALDPANKEVKNSLIRARNQLNQEAQKDRNLYAAMLGGL